MSAALGTDLKSNAEMLGRALETGLIPRTWAFSAALKAQFTEQVKAGNSAEALTILMDELNKRYGGQAAAQLNTYAGSVAALGNEWEQFLENVGDPALLGGKGWNNWWQELVGSFNLMFEVSQKLPPELSATSAQIRYLSRDLGDFSSELEVSTEHFDGTREVFDGLASSLGMMDPKVQAVGLAFGYLDEQAINMMVAMKNFDAALDAWGNKPITKKIVIDMWFNAMGGLAVQQGMDDRGAYLQAQAERIQAGTTTTGNPMWIPDPTNPGHYMLNPSHKASGGYVSGRYAITGDSLSGRRTGYEELVDFQQKRVYSAPQTRAMGAVKGYAAGSGEIDLSYQTIQDLANAVAQKMSGYV